MAENNITTIILDHVASENNQLYSDLRSLDLNLSVNDLLSGNNKADAKKQRFLKMLAAAESDGYLKKAGNLIDLSFEMLKKDCRYNQSELYQEFKKFEDYINKNKLPKDIPSEIILSIMSIEPDISDFFDSDYDFLEDEKIIRNGLVLKWLEKQSKINAMEINLLDLSRTEISNKLLNHVLFFKDKEQRAVYREEYPIRRHYEHKFGHRYTQPWLKKIFESFAENLWDPSLMSDMIDHVWDIHLSTPGHDVFHCFVESFRSYNFEDAIPDYKKNNGELFFNIVEKSISRILDNYQKTPDAFFNSYNQFLNNIFSLVSNYQDNSDYPGIAEKTTPVRDVFLELFDKSLKSDKKDPAGVLICLAKTRNYSFDLSQSSVLSVIRKNVKSDDVFWSFLKKHNLYDHDFILKAMSCYSPNTKNEDRIIMNDLLKSKQAEQFMLEVFEEHVHLLDISGDNLPQQAKKYLDGISSAMVGATETVDAIIDTLLKPKSKPLRNKILIEALLKNASQEKAIEILSKKASFRSTEYGANMWSKVKLTRVIKKQKNEIKSLPSKPKKLI